MFSRNGSSDAGWSMVPHGLCGLNIPHGAKILLLWLHSHTDAFLGDVTMNQCRRAIGASDSVFGWFNVLEKAGFVTVDRRPNGRPSHIALEMDAWISLNGRRKSDQVKIRPVGNQTGNQSEIRLVTSRKSDCTEDQGEDQGEDHSAVSAKKPLPPERIEAERLFKAWYDVQETKPVVKYIAAVKIVEKCLVAGWSSEEVASALPAVPALTATCFDFWRKQNVPSITVSSEPIQMLEGKERNVYDGSWWSPEDSRWMQSPNWVRAHPEYDHLRRKAR